MNPALAPITEISDTLLAERKVEVDMLKAHNALILAKVATKDRMFVFDKLRKKVKEAAKMVASKPITDIQKDMSEVGAVRAQSEALLGKFVPEEEQNQGPKVASHQLQFLVGAKLVISSGAQPASTAGFPAGSPGESGVVIDVQTDTSTPQSPSAIPGPSQP